MATIPTPAVSKNYVFLIAPPTCRLAALPFIRTVSILANTEAEARAQLPCLPLVFLSCCPAQEVAA